MRRYIIPMIAISLAAAPAAVHAQRAGARPAPRAQAPVRQADPVERILQLRSELGLTATQVTQLEQIRTELQAQNRALVGELQAARPQGPGTRGGLRGGAMQGGRPAAAPVRARPGARGGVARDSMQNLTDEQRAELRARMDARRDSMRSRADEIRARADSMTPEQRAKLREEMQARMGDRRPGAGMPGQAPAAMEQVRANTERAMEQVQSILTAEQRAKLRELRGGDAPRRAPRQR